MSTWYCGLMAGEYRTEEVTGEKVSYYNKPSDPSGYPTFRQIVLHLSTCRIETRSTPSR